MDKAKILEECISYFKTRKVYDSIFIQLHKKYRRLGYLGGTLQLGNLSKEERNQLEGFFQKDFQEGVQVSVTVRMMRNALMESRFWGLTLEEITEAYNRKALVAKSEVQLEEEQKRTDFWKEIYTQYTEEPVLYDWLWWVLEEKGEGYQWFQQQYRDNQLGLKELLYIFQESTISLPYKRNQIELMPVFAARTTGNPHYYDEGTQGYKLLSLYLKYIFPAMKLNGLSEPELKSRRLFAAGLIRDELSNYTVAYGIHGKKNEHTIHAGIEGYYQMQEPVQISLWTLGGLMKVWPDRNEPIYILENPAVFSQMIKQHPTITAVCSNGQPRLATLLLLDFLAEESTFYYAGDFDPEGLLIAQRLKQRYGEKLKFWKYDVCYYQENISAVVLSEQRINKLKKVTEPDLGPIKEMIEHTKCAVYQEAMLEALLDTI